MNPCALGLWGRGQMMPNQNQNDPRRAKDMNPHPQIQRKLAAMTYQQAYRYLMKWYDHFEATTVLAGIETRPPSGKGWLADAVASLHLGTTEASEQDLGSAAALVTGPNGLK